MKRTNKVNNAINRNVLKYVFSYFKCMKKYKTKLAFIVAITIANKILAVRERFRDDDATVIQVKATNPKKTTIGVP